MNRRAFFGLFHPAIVLAPGIMLKHSIGPQSRLPVDPPDGDGKGPIHTLGISISEEVLLSPRWAKLREDAIEALFACFDYSRQLAGIYCPHNGPDCIKTVVGRPLKEETRS